MKPRILLTGKTGQIGSELLRLLPEIGHVFAPDRHELDMLSAENIRQVVRYICPKLIINAAAYTAVDAAETQDDKCYAMNATAPAVLAEEVKKIGGAIVHYSTDYVFDGSKRTSYVETDLASPINVYGKSKLAGEEAIASSGVPHLILRTAWVYSREGRNFLRTILRLATEKEQLRIVRDQFGAPTWSRVVAEATVEVLSQLPRQGGAALSLSKAGGIYHLTAQGKTTWYEFACAILEKANQTGREVPWFAEATRRNPIIAKSVIPISSREYPTQAVRPAFSVLSNERFIQTFGIELPDWHTQLLDMFGSKAISLQTAAVGKR